MQKELLPEYPYTEFFCMTQGVQDYWTKVIPLESKEHGTMMVICAEEGAIYITREQAQEFFGFSY